MWPWDEFCCMKHALMSIGINNWNVSFQVSSKCIWKFERSFRPLCKVTVINKPMKRKIKMALQKLLHFLYSLSDRDLSSGLGCIICSWTFGSSSSFPHMTASRRFSAQSEIKTALSLPCNRGFIPTAILEWPRAYSKQAFVVKGEEGGGGIRCDLKERRAHNIKKRNSDMIQVKC
jgi:hypothetical protein